MSKKKPAVGEGLLDQVLDEFCLARGGRHFKFLPDDMQAELRRTMTMALLKWEELHGREYAGQLPGLSVGTTLTGDDILALHKRWVEAGSPSSMEL